MKHNTCMQNRATKYQENSKYTYFGPIMGYIMGYSCKTKNLPV